MDVWSISETEPLATCFRVRRPVPSAYQVIDIAGSEHHSVARARTPTAPSSPTPYRFWHAVVTNPYTQNLGCVVMNQTATDLGTLKTPPRAWARTAPEKTEYTLTSSPLGAERDLGPSVRPSPSTFKQPLVHKHGTFPLSTGRKQKSDESPRPTGAVADGPESC